jgi:pSer/pThr/pTyr-binding forkhead associated (FHA) protein
MSKREKPLQPAGQLPRRTIAEPAPGELDTLNQKDRVQRFRPSGRMPVPLLTVLDDGSDREGEVIRIRKDCFVIGREEGDLTLPCDKLISNRHLEFRCLNKGGQWRWFLNDLKTTNGTFLRFQQVRMYDRMDLFLGTTRFRVSMPSESAQGEKEADRGGTRAFSALNLESPNLLVPTLTRLDSQSDAPQSFPLLKATQTLGTDAAKCTFACPDDPCMNPVHARFTNDSSVGWQVQDLGTRNGSWVALSRLQVSRRIEIQLGMQRLIFEVPSPVRGKNG